MAHPRSCSWLFEKEGGSERSVQLYKHDKFILSYGAWAWSSLGDILQGQVCGVQVSSPDRRQTEGYILILPDSFILTVTFWGLPQTPHALLSSVWLSELFQYLVWNISCSPTGNKYENSKGVVSMATTTSWKVSELLPPTHGTAEIQKA